MLHRADVEDRNIRRAGLNSHNFRDYTQNLRRLSDFLLLQSQFLLLSLLVPRRGGL